jgi:hypothetical protein
MDWTTITEISGGTAAGVGGLIAIFWKKIAPFFKSFQKDKTKLAEMKIEAKKEVELAKHGSSANDAVIKMLTERVDKLEREAEEDHKMIIDLQIELATWKERYAVKTAPKSRKTRAKKE